MNLGPQPSGPQGRPSRGQQSPVGTRLPGAERAPWEAAVGENPEGLRSPGLTGEHRHGFCCAGRTCAAVWGHMGLQLFADRKEAGCFVITGSKGLLHPWSRQYMCMLLGAPSVLTLHQCHFRVLTYPPPSPAKEDCIDPILNVEK